MGRKNFDFFEFLAIVVMMTMLFPGFMVVVLTFVNLLNGYPLSQCLSFFGCFAGIGFSAGIVIALFNELIKRYEQNE
ncbi:MAG: hypothetical protein ACTSYD_02510 [Candidatus Heimdallarchaeaceae archaeon]